jgi:hypothetical protein
MNITDLLETPFVPDSRRMQQLQYFGEVFDHSRCGEMTNMRCDNCTRNLTSQIQKVSTNST